MEHSERNEMCTININCFNMPPDMEDLFRNYTAEKISLINEDYNSVWKQISNTVKSMTDKMNDDHQPAAVLQMLGDKIDLLVKYTLNVISYSCQYEKKGNRSAYFFVYLDFLQNEILKATTTTTTTTTTRFGTAAELGDALSDVCLLVLQNITNKRKYTEETEQIAVKLLRYRVVNSLNAFGKVTKASVKEITAITRYLAGIADKDERTLNELNSLLVDTVLESQKLLGSANGKELIASLLVVDGKLIISTRDRYEQILKTCKSFIATRYADVIFRTWHVTSPDTKQLIERDFILYFIRKALELPLLDERVERRNVYRLLFYWRAHGKHRFERAMTELYEQVIYLYAKADVYHYKFNALYILGNIYPMDKPYSSLQIYSACLLRQHRMMFDMLTDDYVNIRVMAIRRIGHLMRRWIVTFKNDSDARIIEILFGKLILDETSADVRAAAFRVLADLTKIQSYWPLLKPYLRKLGPAHFCFERNNRTRSALIKLLCAIDDEPNIGVLSRDIVDGKIIVKFLHVETLENAKLLIKLTCSRIYQVNHDDMPAIVNASERIVAILIMNRSCASVLGTTLTDLLPLTSACSIMRLMLLALKKTVKKQKQQQTDLVVEQATSSSSSAAAAAAIQSDDSQQEQPRLNIIDQFISTQLPLLENIETVYAMLEFITVLWTGYKERLLKSENSEQRDKMVDAYTAIIPALLLKYKDTVVFFVILRLALLIPSSKLANNTTIIGKCLSLLRNMEESDSSDLKALAEVTYSLIVINRGTEVIDLAMEYIGGAFRRAGIDQSVRLVAVRQSNHVKFDIPVGSPANGVMIMNFILNNEDSLAYVKVKYRQEIVDLYEFLRSVRPLIENRIAQRSEIDENTVTDKFLNDLFYVYFKLPLWFNADGFVEFADLDAFLVDISNWMNDMLNKCNHGVDDDNSEQFVLMLISSSIKLIVNIHYSFNVPTASLLNWYQFVLSLANYAKASKFTAPSMIVYLAQLVHTSAMRIHIDKPSSNEIRSTWIRCLLSFMKIIADQLRGLVASTRDDLAALEIDMPKLVDRVRRSFKLFELVDASLDKIFKQETCLTILSVHYESVKENLGEIVLAETLNDLPFIVSELCSLLLDNRIGKMMVINLYLVLGRQNLDRKTAFISWLSLAYTLLLLSGCSFDKRPLKVMLNFIKTKSNFDCSGIFFVGKIHDVKCKRCTFHELLEYLLGRCI